MSATISVNEIKDAKCVQWKIPQFFQTSQDIEQHKCPIPFFHKDFTLYVYPRGAGGATPDLVMISLYMLNPDSHFSVDLFIDVEGCENAFFSSTEDGKNEEGDYRIWVWLYESEELQTLLKDDVLRGRLTISRDGDSSNPSSTAVAACQTTFSCNTVPLCRDFQDLLLSGQKSDVSIEVQGRMFKVHKLILEACSHVFASLFDVDVAETENAIVKIEDCDPDTFHNFLTCLYAGKLENISPSSLMSLYKISHKYCVSDLKKKCSEFMEKELSEDTVFDVLAVADLCNDTQLRGSVETFLIKNIKMILRTKTWKKIQSENPSLAAEILTKVFED